MPIYKAIILKFLDDFSFVNIKEKINELMEPSFYNFHSKINISSNIPIKAEDLKIYKICFLEVAKLSINLFVDFSFYKRFKFKENLSNSLYKERLCSLGYGCENGIWKYTSLHEPNQLIIQENIFLYHLICKLLESKVVIGYIFMKNEMIEKFDVFNESQDECSDVDEPILVSRSGNQISSNQTKEIDETIEKFGIFKKSLDECSDVDEPILVSRSGNQISSNQTKEIDETIEKFGIFKKSLDECSDVDEPILVSRSGNQISSNQENETDRILRHKISDKTEISLNYNKDELILESIGAQSRDSWICNQCSFVNDSDLKNCGTCFLSNDLLKENSSSLTSPSDKSENENEIGLENSTENFVETAKTVYNYWVCPNCTFKNKSDCLNCETCLKSIDINTQIISEYLPDSIENPIENLPKLFQNGNLYEKSIKIPDVQDLNTPIEKKTDNSSKGSLRNCLKCKNLIDKNQQEFLCVDCSKLYLVCCNEACTQLSKADKSYCSKCKVRKNSDMKNGNLFDVKSMFSYEKKWQCSFCFRFNDKFQKKCRKCHNSRGNTYKV